MPLKDEISGAFDARVKEIDCLFQLLKDIDSKIKDGKLKSSGLENLTPEAHRVMISGLILQLYNLVEGIMTISLNVISNKIMENEVIHASMLNDYLRDELIRFVGKTHKQTLTPENRLLASRELIQLFGDGHNLTPFEIERASGSWDDIQIYSIGKRIGLKLKTSRGVSRSIKSKIRDDLCPLKLLATLRNNLAHGNISFEQCGSGWSISDIEALKVIVVEYIKEVVGSFSLYLENKEYLKQAA